MSDPGTNSRFDKVIQIPSAFRGKSLVTMAKEIDNDGGKSYFVDWISRMLRWWPEDGPMVEDSHLRLPQTTSE